MRVSAESGWLGHMELTRLRTCLEDDYRLLHATISKADPAARVPPCPDWTVTDLADHVAEVYRHKTACIQLGVEPDPWPVQDDNADPDLDSTSTSDPAPDPIAALDQAYTGLLAQFDAHQPDDHAGSWYEPGQSVAFWIRRMAQETVIHRVDAELAAGPAPTAIPEDLAVDGIDEILNVFVAYSSVAWLDDFASLLTTPDQRPLVLAAGDHAWSVMATKAGVLVEQIPAGTTPEATGATVTGTAQNLLLWLWNRADDTVVSLSGDPGLLTQFHGLRVIATQ